MKKKIFIIIAIIVIIGLAMELKVATNRADAMDTVGYPTELRVKSTNGIIWQITVDDNGVLGTDSIGIAQ